MTARTAIGLLLASVLTVFTWGGRQSSQGAAEAARRQFWSDELIFSARDESGDQILIEIGLHRKQDERSGEFHHYYDLSIIAGGMAVSRDESFMHAGHAVPARGFLGKFENIPHPDHSSRESYRLDVSTDGHELSIAFEDLSGDFIVKNTLDYTKYVSEAPARLILNGREIRARGLATKIYSSDYSQHIFFPGYDTLQSETSYLVVWDEQGGMTLVDKSRVSGSSERYASHTWILRKDPRGAMRKAFEAEVVRTTDGDRSREWLVSIPELEGLQLRVVPVMASLRDAGEGMASGELAREDLRSTLHGRYGHHRYNH